MKKTILVIDDDIMNIKTAQMILKDEYKVATAESGFAAFKILEHMIPNLILLDLNMPNMNGFEVIKQLRHNSKTSEIPVIILTSDNNESAENSALELGADDFVCRPFSPQVLINRIKRLLEVQDYRMRLEMMVKEQAEEIVEHVERLNRIQKEIIISMANLIECRDGSTGGHVKRTGLYVDLLVNQLIKLDTPGYQISKVYAEHLCSAAYIHDIGKVKISDTILQKPGKLTDEEYTEMKKHAADGGEIVRMIFQGIEDENYIQIAEEVAKFHHEKWDGTGYPNQLKGNEIPLSARIMAIADVFDALSSKRCYKDAIDFEKSFQIMEEMSGTSFDPYLLSIFLNNKEQVLLIQQSFL